MSQEAVELRILERTLKDLVSELEKLNASVREIKDLLKERTGSE